MIAVSPRTVRLPVVRSTRTIAEFSCTGCGSCCEQGYDVPVERAIYDGLMAAAAGLPALEARRWQGGLEVTHLDGKDDYARLRQRDGGACVFLDGDRLCAIHKLLGAEAKPFACRAFPMAVSQLPTELVATTLTFLCEPLVDALAGGRREASGTSAMEVPCADGTHAVLHGALAEARVFPLGERAAVAVAAWPLLEARVREILQVRGAPFAGRLLFAHAWLGEIAAASSSAGVPADGAAITRAWSAVPPRRLRDRARGAASAKADLTRTVAVLDAVGARGLGGFVAPHPVREALPAIRAWAGFSPGARAEAWARMRRERLALTPKARDAMREKYAVNRWLGSWAPPMLGARHALLVVAVALALGEWIALVEAERAGAAIDAPRFARALAIADEWVLHAAAAMPALATAALDWATDARTLHALVRTD